MQRALLFLFAMLWAHTAAAQNLVIINARILDGKGGAIDRGSIVVRDGKIASVAAGTATPPSGARVIDAQGRTVMPGYIDAHRHLIQGDGQRWLKEQAPDLRSFQWQGGYADFSVSVSNIDDVKRYIAGQPEHHRKVNFQDELRLLLRKHQIEWDEKYLWD